MATRTTRSTTRPSSPSPKPLTPLVPSTDYVVLGIPKNEERSSRLGRGPIPRQWVPKELALVSEQWRIGRYRKADQYSNAEAQLTLQGVAGAEGIRDKGAKKLGKVAERYDKRQAELATLKAEMTRLPSRPVVGARGELLTADEAATRMTSVAGTVTKETDEGNLKHRRVPRWLVVLMPFAVVLDAPVLTYFTSEIFNVDWQNLGKSIVPLLTSIVFAILGTAAIATSLHFFGRDVKGYKDKDGHVSLPKGKARILPLVFFGLAVLVSVGSGVVMAYRIISDSLNAGNGALAGSILGVFFAIIVIALNVVIFSVNYRDGSTQTDELDHHTRQLLPGRRRGVKVQKKIDRLTPKLAVLRASGDRMYDATVAKMNGPMTGASQLILQARSYHQGCGAEAELVGAEDEPQYGALLPVVTVDTTVLDNLIEHMKPKVETGAAAEVEGAILETDDEAGNGSEATVHVGETAPSATTTTTSNGQHGEAVMA